MDQAMSNASPDTPQGHVVTDSVCAFCSCACDDIDLHIEGDRIVEARNACPPARATFLAYQPSTEPACLIDGKPSSVEDGIERAAKILAESRQPLICGSGEATSEAYRAGIALGDRIGACVDFSGEGGNATGRALSTVGQATCTLGEVRQRADFVLVWRANPIATHPRLLGHHIPVREGRFVAIVDVRETESVQETADQFLEIGPEGEVEALWTLRAMAAGIAFDPVKFEKTTGLSIKSWQALFERMKAARFGVIFYDSGTREPIAHGIHSLVRDLNATTPFACIPLPLGANLVGARNVMAWSTGYPGSVSLSRGYPRYGPGEFGARRLLLDGVIDAALVVGGVPESVDDDLVRTRTIVLISNGDEPPTGAAVVFRTARFGISTTGTVYRLDGIPLPLRAVLPSPFPSVEDIIRAIEHRVRSMLAELGRA